MHAWGKGGDDGLDKWKLGEEIGLYNAVATNVSLFSITIHLEKVTSIDLWWIFKEEMRQGDQLGYRFVYLFKRVMLRTRTESYLEGRKKKEQIWETHKLATTWMLASERGEL